MNTSNSKFINHSISDPREQNHVNRYECNHGFKDLSVLSDGSNPVGESSSEGNTSEEPDDSDAILKYIKQILMEEDDLDLRPCTFHDSLALLAAEKSLYDVLGGKYPNSPNQHHSCALNQYSDNPNADFTGVCSSDSINTSTDVNNFVESNRKDPGEFESPLVQPSLSLQPMQSLGSSNSVFTARNSYDPKLKDKASKVLEEAEESGRDHSSYGSRRKKNQYQENSDYTEELRSKKHLASYVEESEQSEMYDKALLCDSLFRGLHIESGMCDSDEASQYGTRNKLQQSEGSNRGRPHAKKQGIGREVVDLRSLLTQCSQAVASYDIKTANELLKRIRQHSSACGDGTERLAHYFAIALEARMAGTGSTLHTAFATSRVLAADILKSYHLYISVCPFIKMSIIFANKSIMKLADGATRLHIIDFGILYGFQWPSLIQTLSERPGGPPKLCITGIDLPQSGFRPAERVEETGWRLANYCKRFNVPFEYNTIAMKWDTIRLEDLKIDRDELLVVTCFYRLENVPDETVTEKSPRDAVLKLIKRINPDMFLHGVVNGTYNTPFFSTRFRETLFHFSDYFNMFEATVSRENQDRMRFEQEVLGRNAVNIIACEGAERVERPETYKQWQVRIMRARFRQLPLDHDIVNGIRDKVKSRYHKDFAVDEDGNWMLQGWRGRVIHALSCWKPVQE
ncbi:unnamed protein product [Ilex paraguariensis]|uniref:Uncharacterized protein n=1 Tax=Ilex paraguariensis TaxID=185542 RepID=A0ABC8R2C1_9AQUA